jgi:hypothetical protein
MVQKSSSCEEVRMINVDSSEIFLDHRKKKEI